MRTALLAAVKRTEAGETRAFLPLAGRSVLGWQTDLSRQAGCERIICLSEGLDPEMLSLQHECEELGHEFHVVRSNAQIAALVRAGDELLAICDGLVVDPKLVDDWVGSAERFPPTVYCLKPDDPLAQAAPSDFERIDADHCWAGLLAARAETLQSLAEMPADSDAMSTLMRIVLQSGARRIELKPEQLLDGRLLLADSPDKLAARAKHLVEHAALPPFWSGPGQALARLLAPRIVSAGVPKAPEIGAVSGLLLMCGAFALAWGGLGAAGLGLAALGSFAGTCSNALFHLRSKLFGAAARPFRIEPLRVAFATIPILVVIGALAPTREDLAIAAIPILSFGLAGILAHDADPQAKAFWSDRTLHLTGLAVASASGVLAEAMALFGIAALGHKLLRMRQN